MAIGLKNILVKSVAMTTQRSFRIAAYACSVALLVVIISAWIGLPLFIRWGLETQGSAALGRQVSVEKVSFNPFTLRTRIESLKIAAPDGKSALLSVRQINADLSWSSLWYGSPVLDGLQIEQPALHFSRLGQDRYSFNDIIERLNASAKTTKPSSPLRFSVNNIELNDGKIDFDDLPIGKHHRVEGIRLGVPFISNLPTRIQLAVAPRLDAKLNGTAFHLEGQIKPFANAHEARLDIRFSPFDLTQYLGYAPFKLPVTIERGDLGCELHLVWGQGAQGAQRFSLNGRAELNRLILREADGTPFLGIRSLALDLRNLEPLASPALVSIARLQIDEPELLLQRRADGLSNLERLFLPKVDKTSPPIQKPAVSLAKFDLNGGILHWQDEAVPGSYALSLNPVGIHIQGLDLGADKAASLELTASGEHGEALSFSGGINPLRGNHRGHLAVKGIRVEDLRPYYQALIGQAQLRGSIEAESDVVLDTAETLRFNLLQAKADGRNLALLAPGVRKALVEIPEFSLDGLSFDLAKHELALEHFSAADARWMVVKQEQGKYNLLELLQPQASNASNQATDLETSATRTEASWGLRLGEAHLTGWRLHFEDRSGHEPVSLDLHELGVHLADWTNATGHRAKLDITGKANRNGRIALAGKLASTPLQGQLQVEVRDVDLLAIQPYVDQHFKILVTRGRLSSKGLLDFDLTNMTRPDIRFVGHLAVDEFSSLDRLNDTDFLQWRHFGGRDIAFTLQPLALSAKELRLDDFYSRLILDAQGRFNLRELATEDKDQETSKTDPANSAPVVASMPAKIKVDSLLLSGGAINYSDRFIKPNYDAKLAAVNGLLANLSSDPKSVAQLDLKAAVDGAAPVLVSAQLNPLRQDRFLDLKAQVKGIDLTSVSTYAAKYVGYGIEKGKLSMDLKYQIRDRKLTAENQLYLDQLTFGERVESPDATKLPVLFAVALLKNRNGEIDINLPIGGSLDDPQFSVGGIVVKVVVNLITKAATSPFALIGSLFGGSGEELSYLDFAPGKADLSAVAIEKLQSITKVLNDRPALRLDIGGQVAPALDLDGLNRARLEERLRAVKAALLVKAGESVSDVDTVTIETSEYPQLLEMVYDAERITAKPRNALGLPKTVPLDEMEKLLLSHFAKDAPDLQSLASNRAKVVRDWLVTQGKISPERIFLLGAEHHAAGTAKSAEAPRVLFSLK